MNNNEVWIFSSVRELEAAEYLHLGGFWLQSMMRSRKAVELSGMGVLLFVGVEYKDIEQIKDIPVAISRKIEVMGLYHFSAAIMVEIAGMQRLDIYSQMDDQREEAPHLMFDRDSSARSLWCARAFRVMAIHVMAKTLRQA